LLLVPIFLDVRTNFINKPLSPYFAIGAGYSVAASHDFKEVGLLLKPSAGMSIRVAEKAAMNIGIGYEVQNLRNVPIGYYQYYLRNKVQSDAIALNIGISF